MLEAKSPVCRREVPRELAARFMPVIRQIALRVARRLPSHVNVDDLIGAGYVGFVDAYGRYEPSRCDRFDVYAQVRIKGAMLDELRSYDPLSRDLRAMANRVAATRRGLESRLGRAPSEAELAEALGMPVEHYRTYASKIAVGATVSIDAAQEDEGRFELSDTAAVPADEQMLLEQGKRALLESVGQLPDRLKMVIEYYYRDELTLREIGQRLGVTESRVCQLHGEAVARLRAASAAQDGGSTRPRPAAARRASASLAA